MGESEKKYAQSADDTITSDYFFEGLRQEDFRMWHDSTGFYRQEAALAGYKDGVVRLSSPGGERLEIPEGKLAQEDLTYLRSRGVCETAQSKPSGFVGKLLKAFKSR